MYGADKYRVESRAAQYMYSAYVKISQLVLQQVSQQAVNRLHSHRFSRVDNKFVTTCWQLVTNLTAISDLLQGCMQTCCSKIVRKLTAQDCNNIVVSWLFQSCWSNLVASLLVPSSLLQVVNSLFQIRSKTTCQQRVNTQACYKSNPNRVHKYLFQL